jgi:ANTAR domain
MALPSPGERPSPDGRPGVVSAPGLGSGSGDGERGPHHRVELRAVDPVEFFTGLAAKWVPAFCDGLRVDLAEAGGPPVSASFGLATDRAHSAGGSSAGRIEIAVQSEPVADESPIAGTITCAWHDLDRPSDTDEVVARLLADQAVARVRIESLAANLREQRVRVGNLQEALATNREIGQAIGILMAIDRLTATQAFERLRTASQHLHRKLRDVAAEVTETGGLIEFSGSMREQSRLGSTSSARAHRRAEPSTLRHQQRPAQRPGPRESDSWPLTASRAPRAPAG